MTVEERISALAEGLAELTDPEWRAALYAIPRHLFVPEVAWASPYDAPSYRIDRKQAPATWWDAVYADQAIITQLDDGATEIGSGDGSYTSSLSAPGVVIEFLELLDVYEGDRILEIGTGTGWTAGLLATRVGDKNVTSIEIDPQLADQAANNLKACGILPRLLVGDGMDGFPSGAEYDRIHVTCGVREVPYTWIEQTRPGGVIVLPWMPEFEPGHKVSLIVGNDGTATGRFSGGTRYMMMRGQRTPPAPRNHGGYRERQATLDPRRLFRTGYGADVTIAGCLTDVSVTTLSKGEDFEVWLWAGESGAHAIGLDVQQFGNRDLWDEIEAAYFRWLNWGQPERQRFGMTVTPEGQHIWLDSPDNPITA